MKALVLLGLLLASEVHAGFEVGAGQANYRTYGDGIWYQQGSPGNKLDTHGDAYLIGWVFHPHESLDLHIDYVNLGKASASCWCTSDLNYDAGKHVVIDPHYPVKPAYFNGSGYVQGIQLKATYWLNNWAGADFGVMAYQNRWTEAIYGWTSETWHQPINGTHTTSTAVRPAILFGGSLRTSGFTLAVDAVLMKPHPMTGTPSLWRNAYMATVTVEL